MSKSSALIDLSGKIVRAWQKRKSLREQASAVRTVNDMADDIPGLTVDVINQTAVVSSTTELVDKNLERITEILINKLSLETIWIKNDSPQRTKLGLILSDYIAYGPSPVFPVLIRENGLTYSWSHAQKTFSIGQRPLRTWIHNDLPSWITTPESHTLVLGFSYDELISAENKNTAIHFATAITATKNLTECCQEIRTLKDGAPYDMVILNHPHYTPSLKNRTALFHFYFNLFNLIGRESLLYLSCPFWHKVQRTFDHVAKRKKYKYKILETAPAESDFREEQHADKTAFLKMKIFPSSRLR